MTYREMMNLCLQATSCELDQDMSIYDKSKDEFFHVTGTQVVGESPENPGEGVLDEGHLYLEIEG